MVRLRRSAIMLMITVDDERRPVAINELTDDDGREIRDAVEALNLLKAYHGDGLILSVTEQGGVKAVLAFA
jgi:hypothetical protein